MILKGDIFSKKSKLFITFKITKIIFLKKALNNILTIGVDVSMPLQLCDRIKIINKFCLLCIAYTIPYIFFSVYLKFYSSAVVFFIAQLLFIFSLYLNKVQKFEISKTFVVIATNFSVFYLSLFYGAINSNRLKDTTFFTKLFLYSFVCLKRNGCTLIKHCWQNAQDRGRFFVEVFNYLFLLKKIIDIRNSKSIHCCWN